MAPGNTSVPGGTVLPGPGPITAIPNPARPPLGTGRIEAADLGAFTLEGGATLPLTIAYRHDGTGPDAPQVLVIHALTGSADAAGDWWAPLIGAGRAFDTTRVGVLCANLLGGRYGSTGPTTTNPATGKAWGAAFPQPTARDEARAIWRLADALGIAPIRARDRRVPRRHDQPGGRAGATPRRAPRGPHRGSRGHGTHGHRVEPHPARDHSSGWATRACRSPASWR